jgi:hypothetical protein
MVFLSVLCYLAIGYFVVRWAHNIESCPNVTVAILAVIVWPLVLFIIAIIALWVVCHKEGIAESLAVERFLGKSKSDKK